MNLFERIRAVFMPGRATDEPDPRNVVRVFGIGGTTAGVNVTQDNALQNSAVWACTTYLARTVAQLPWRVMRELPNGTDERYGSHPVDWVIRKRSNPEMSAFTFREVLTGWAVRWGNGVAEIQRDNRGIPVALWPIHPSRGEFVRDIDTGELLYKVNNGTDAPTYLRPSQYFHVRGYGDGPIGLDVVSYAAESIGWARATELFGASFFGNGANPSGFITSTAGKISDPAKKALERDLREKHGGPRKANRVMVLDGTLKYEKSGVEPDKAQFVESMQHQVEEMCRWFGVPPHKVMHLLRSTFANIEHQAIEVVTDSITPWCIRFEQEADFKLFGANRSALFTKMDLKGLLRGDFKSRQEGLQVQRRNGVINANEWRRLEDMDEIGPDGDKYIVEGNMTTLEAVGEQQVDQGQQAPLPQIDAPGSQDAAGASQDDSVVNRARQQAERAIVH